MTRCVVEYSEATGFRDDAALPGNRTGARTDSEARITAGRDYRCSQRARTGHDIQGRVTPGVAGVNVVSGVRILAVDDNEINLRLICATLELSGYEVTAAGDAETARELIGAQSFDLILMDVDLPGMDGLSFTRALKGDRQTSHIPVVILSSFAMKGDRERIMACGCEAYLSKPIDTRSFRQLVSRYLPLP